MDADLSLKCPTQASCKADVVVMENGQLHRRRDTLAQETPVALEFNGVSHVVMLATPQDLEDFVLGFSIAEGIVSHASQIYAIELETGPTGITAHIDIATENFVSLKEKRRNMTGRTGCGLCGTESLTQVVRKMPVLPATHIQLEARSIERALSDLRHHQDLQQSTGATHAAAWFDLQGGFKLLREDVGRHNALDKLIGAGLVNRHPDWQQGMLVITSRASMEMVQKAVIAGFHFLVAISAPTSLAVELAQEHGLCLIGFARPGKWTIYSHAEKMQLTEHSGINSSSSRKEKDGYQ